MRRASPKLLVLIAAVLTIALLAFVFAGGRSTGDRLPRDRLTDQQAGVTAPGPAAPSVPAIPPDSEEIALTAPPPAPEPEVEPGPVTQLAPIVRPAPPAQPRRSANAEAGDTARSPALAKARADAQRQPDRSKPKATAAASGRRPAESPTRTADAPAPARVAIAKPSYNCRYARTRSEIAVCADAGLARLDQQMAAQFNTAVRQATPAQREVLERSRLRFLYRRDRCRSAGCIAEIYRARMSEINDIAARHWRDP